MELAAFLAVVLIVVVAAFQGALAAGAPLGAAAWGGQSPGVLPPRLRLTSAFVALVVYPAIAAFILDAAGVVEAGWLGRSRALEMWGLTAFFALGAVLNALSRSRPERAWAPVSFV
ncbi:MAG: hypothetical protein O2822_04130, partial [Chloroflexi bacterium]|nr:hypothetical protein [Chloroflexota bacterium]